MSYIHSACLTSSRHITTIYKLTNWKLIHLLCGCRNLKSYCIFVAWWLIISSTSNLKFVLNPSLDFWRNNKVVFTSIIFHSHSCGSTVYGCTVVYLTEALHTQYPSTVLVYSPTVLVYTGWSIRAVWCGSSEIKKQWRELFSRFCCPALEFQDQL